MSDQDISQAIQSQVQAARESGRAVRILGGKSKSFYGPVVTASDAEVISLAGHRGVISYEPTELVIRARAGTPLRQNEIILAQQNQMLGFEPPAFGEGATLGGTIACNFSGPRRAFAGAARDFVLGCSIINGKADKLRFGGEVMKNVAGYDVSRLMCGSLGTLGVLLDISVKVLPRPETEITLVQEVPVKKALQQVHELARQALPISATCFDENELRIRLSGSEGAVAAAKKIVGGEPDPDHDAFWSRLKEQQLGFFQSDLPLWRLSLASTAPTLKLDGKTLYEWNGAQRWLLSAQSAEVIRAEVEKYGGHATCFRADNKPDAVFHPLPAALLSVQEKLKQAFDPEGIFNPGGMYPSI